MKDFFEYILKDKDGNEIDYDYESIVRDVWEYYGYPGKLDTIALVMRFSKGRLDLSRVIATFNKVKNG